MTDRSIFESESVEASQMEQKQICSSLVYDRLPPLSANYPWLVAQIVEEEEEEEEEKEEEDVKEEEEEEDEEDTKDQVFFSVHDPMSYYRCRIPELLGRHIRGCSHGWVVLSDGDKWYLWNPITSKFIHLPHLILKDGDPYDIDYCCLSSPPDDPGSVLLLTRDTKPNIVFCRLDRKKKRLRWIEMSYSKQLMSITSGEDSFLHEPTCCNGKIYALTNASMCVVEIHILVKGKEVVISLLPFVSLPRFYSIGRCFSVFLKGSCEELFLINVGFTDVTRKKLVDVSLYKLDISSMVWAEMNELKGMVFFVDVGWSPSVTCSPAIASELGGYIHILHETGKVIYSYHVKGKSISQSCMNCLDLPPRSGALRTSHISVWAIPTEFRLLGDDGEAKGKSDATQDEDKEKEKEKEKEDGMVVRSWTNDEVGFNNKTNEMQLLDIPFHVLEMIMEFCVGVEYLNFRATCKLCHLAAPVIRWSNEKARRRLQMYSLTSPWLMTFQKDGGIITFTDPMGGNDYFIKASQELFFGKKIMCSRFGWLLLFIGLQRMVFFNPFTSDIRREPAWRIIPLDFGGAAFPSFAFPVFCGRDVYALSKEGGLQVFKGCNQSLETVVAEAPRSYCRTWADNYLVKCDEHLLLVIVGDFGEAVEVFKLKDSSTKEWEKIDGLGKHMIYICDVTCLCMEAKTPEMENKIYFPRLHSKNGKMVFYSLDTCRYHTFNGRNVDENLTHIFETEQQCYPQAWIEPSWS